MNLIARLEFELVPDDVEIQVISHYTTGIPYLAKYSKK